MKRFVIATVIALVLAASSAQAALFSAIACTKDHKSAALKIELKDNATQTNQIHIRKSFTKAAYILTSQELITKVGFQQFLSGLTKEDIDAIDVIPSPPVIFGECTTSTPKQ